MTNRYFVDTHCHFFNLDDVPIFPTLTAQIPVNTFLTLGLSLKGIAQSALEKFKPSIQFFERPRRRNLERYAEVIWNGIAKNGYDGVILTPLIMDFSKIEDSVEEVQDQAEELVSAINASRKVLDGCNTRVLPLMGLDLRHLDDLETPEQVPKRLGKLFDGILDPSALGGQRKADSVETGTFVGFKLYPPLGFSPYPDDPGIRENYLAFFRFCADRQIPITTHCQPRKTGTYRPGDVSGENADRYTHPENWARVLREVPDLTINFAHLGGDEDMHLTVLNSQGFPAAPDKEQWPWKVMEMVKTYPNAYADLSAYDFNKVSYINALGAALILDENGLLDDYMENPPDQPHLLKNKLLWGSDFPMVIDDWDDNYPKLYSHFQNAMGLAPAADLLKGSVTYGGKSLDIPDRAGLVGAMVSANPQRFLFGQKA